MAIDNGGEYLCRGGRLRPGGRPRSRVWVRAANGFAGALVVLLSLTSEAAGQLSVGGQLGAAIGHHGPAASGLELRPGLAYSISAEIVIFQGISGYLSYTSADFGCSKGFCINDQMRFTSSGISAGALLRVESRLSDFLFRVGALRNRVTGHGTSDRAGFGFEIGGGPTVQVSRRWEIWPEILVRRHAGMAGGVDGRTTLLVAGFGLRYGPPAVPHTLGDRSGR